MSKTATQAQATNPSKAIQFLLDSYFMTHTMSPQDFEELALQLRLTAEQVEAIFTMWRFDGAKFHGTGLSAFFTGIEFPPSDEEQANQAPEHNLPVAPYIAEDGCYGVGAICVAKYGYEQTNAEFYVITRRTPKGFITLERIEDSEEYDNATMTGEVMPVFNLKEGGEKIRRKLHVYNGEERGVKYADSYGWVSLWKGTPVHVSHYA